MRIIMAAANLSPAVASRRAEYDGDFQVQTLLGAHPLDNIARASPTRHENIGMAMGPKEGGKLALGQMILL
jgi:hypothetical protein